MSLSVCMLEEKLVLLPHVCGQVVHRSHISTMELRSHFQEGNAGGDCTLHCIQCGEEALTERLVFVRQHASLFQMSVLGSPTKSRAFLHPALSGNSLWQPEWA